MDNLLKKQIEEAALQAGFVIEHVSLRKRRLHLGYRRAAGPTIWEQVSPDHVSHRGRLDFTTCHTRCTEVEREDKRKLKDALRNIPELKSLAKIIAMYTDHHAKLAEIQGMPGCMTLNVDKPPIDQPQTKET